MNAILDPHKSPCVGVHLGVGPHWDIKTSAHTHKQALG